MPLPGTYTDILAERVRLVVKTLKDAISFTPEASCILTASARSSDTVVVSGSKTVAVTNSMRGAEGMTLNQSSSLAG